MSVVLRVEGRVIIWQVGSSQTILQDTHAIFENYLASSQYHHFVLYHLLGSCWPSVLSRNLSDRLPPKKTADHNFHQASHPRAQTT
jgi:hypothetical protein